MIRALAVERLLEIRPYRLRLARPVWTARGIYEVR